MSQKRPGFFEQMGDAVVAVVAVIFAVLLGFVALCLLVIEKSDGARVGGVVCGVAALGIVGTLAKKHKEKYGLGVSVARRPSSAAGKSAPASRSTAPGRSFESFQWGDPPPSRKQFGYAMSIGAALNDGMNRFQVSSAIDAAVKGSSPATTQQLRELRRLGARDPKFQLTQTQAEEAIDALLALSWLCPKCREKNPNDENARCFNCNTPRRPNEFKVWHG